MIKFERVRPGEYLAKIENDMHIAVVRNGRKWIWWLCGSEDGDWWETDDQGPFPTRKLAMTDAIANYEKLIIY
jgi:hypothetical protein